MRSFKILSLAVLICASQAGSSQTVAYDNTTNFTTGFSFNGQAATVGSNSITRMVADDITLAVPTTSNVIGFRFSVANLNIITNPPMRAIARFYDNDGVDGGPGTYLGGLEFDPIAFNFGLTIYGTEPGTTTLFTTDGTFWAGLAFDNNNGTTGATLPNLNLLGQGIFDPPLIGSSSDLFFRTTNAGSFEGDNPVGGFFTFGGFPIANFAWQFTIQPVPEPGSLLLIASAVGIATACGIRGRRKKN